MHMIRQCCFGIAVFAASCQSGEVAKRPPIYINQPAAAPAKPPSPEEVAAKELSEGIRRPESFATETSVRDACVREYPDRYGVGSNRIVAPWINQPVKDSRFREFTRLDMIWNIGSDQVAVWFIWNGPSAMDWFFFDTLEADGGIGQLPTQVYDRAVNSSRLGEQLYATISIWDLKKCSKAGVSFRARGKRGSREINLPAHFISGFLLACADVYTK
jgi:hypothetical protein